MERQGRLTSSVLHSVEDCVRLIDQVDLESNVVRDLLRIPLNRNAADEGNQRLSWIKEQKKSYIVTRLMNGFPSFM